MESSVSNEDKMSTNTGSASPVSRLYFFYLVVTALVCGAQVMVVEVLGSRIIGPFFGVSLFVWTSLITVTLVALASGYAVGGALSDRRGEPQYLYGIIFIAGLLVLYIPMLKGAVLKTSHPLGLRAGSLVSASLLFGPPLFLLGCVSPYIIKLAAREMRNIGWTVGAFYSVSTVGSVAGTIITGFFLLAYLSITEILTLTGATLIALSAGYFVLFRRKWYFAALMVLPLLFPLESELVAKTLPNGTKVREVFRKESNYGQLKVVDYSFSIFNSRSKFNSREFLMDGLKHNVVDRTTGDSLIEYTYLQNYIPTVIRPGGSSCLVVGLGGGVVPKMYESQGIKTDVVEIDPMVVEVAKKYFGFKVSGDVFLSDARYFLATSDRQYDYLVIDVYSGEAVPSHLLSLEAFGLMKERLKPGGVLTINLFSSIGGDAFMTASVIRTLKEVFDTADAYSSVSIDRESYFGNLVIVAYDGEPVPYSHDKVENFHVHSLIRMGFIEQAGRKLNLPPDTRAIVLTDDYNPVEFFNMDSSEKIRKYIIERTDPDILL